METTQASMTEDERQARIDEIKAREKELDTDAADRMFTEEERTEFEALAEERKGHERAIAEIRARREYIERQAEQPDHREDGAEFHAPRNGSAQGEDIYDLSTVRATAASPEAMVSELRSRALRAVEQAKPKHPATDATAKDTPSRLLDEQDPDGRFARYLLAVGSPTYKRAFGKWISARGQLVALDREEQAAFQQAIAAERALSLTGASGGFAVPFELDTTILNTSNGVVNPIRAISRVEQITVDEWRGITSAGITASYAAEATETTDNAPTLVQPTVSTEKAQAWVPFSIEVGMDWTGLQAQMSELLADAKDTLEAGKFVSGTGTNEPFGVLTGATNTVAAATGLTITLANLYALKNALPPRYRPRATFLANLAILDRFRQFDTVGSSAAIWVDSLQDGVASMLLGRPVYEASEMAGTITNATKVALVGDFSRYLIVDRVGLTVDFVPHVFGANQRPTGQRGLYCYWRNGAKVLDANAFRALTGTT